MISSPTATRTRLLGALAAVLLVAALAALALHAWRTGGDDSNLAFVSPTTTEALLQESTATTEKIFSIRPDRVAETQRQAAAALVGDGVGQYDKLYGPYLQQAQSNGLTLRTTVRTLGVIWLKGDDAELLVFADQAATTPSGQSGSGPAQLVLRMHRADDAWKVSGIRLI
jgi:Mce-associated membrane protein